MRSIWKGAVTFGLVNVPVKLFGATESHDVALHQIHDADGGRIRYQRRCEVCDKVIDYDHIAKAYDDGEHTVPLTEDDFASLPAERSREIEVVEFVPSEQIDPILLDKTYVLEPDSKSPKAYVLLMRTLEKTDRTAIVKFALRQKTRLAALRVHDGVLAVQTLLWADEIRHVEFESLDQDVRISAKELEMSAALVDSYATDFEPEKFTDEYQVELTKLIDAKIEAGDAVDTEATFGAAPREKEAEVIDLMDALRRSVEKARKDKSSASSKSGANASAGADVTRTATKTPSGGKKASSDAKKPSGVKRSG